MQLLREAPGEATNTRRTLKITNVVMYRAVVCFFDKFSGCVDRVGRFGQAAPQQDRQLMREVQLSYAFFLLLFPKFLW